MWQESKNNLFNVSSLICNNVDLFAIKCCHIVLSLFRQKTLESSKSKHLPVQFNGSNRTEAEFQQLSNCLLPYKAINLYTSSHFEEIVCCCLYTELINSNNQYRGLLKALQQNSQQRVSSLHCQVLKDPQFGHSPS